MFLTGSSHARGLPYTLYPSWTGIIPCTSRAKERSKCVVFGPYQVGRISGHALWGGVYRADVDPGRAYEFVLRAYRNCRVYRRAGPTLSGTCWISHLAEGQLRAHWSRGLLHGRRGSFSPDSSRSSALVGGKDAVGVSRHSGALGRVCWFGALRGGQPASEGITTLVWGGVHRCCAGIYNRIGALGRSVRRGAWRDTVWASVDSAGLRALVTEGADSEATFTRELNHGGS